MYKILILALGLSSFIFGRTHAQQLPSFIPDSLNLPHSEYSFNGNFHIVSNHLSTEFARAFWRGEFLNNDLKSNALKKLKDENGLKYFNSIGISALIPYDSLINNKTAILYFELRKDKILSAQFNDRLFELTFFGNQHLVNEHIPLNNQFYYNSEFQIAKAGVIFQLNSSNALKKKHLGIGFSMINNSDYQRIGLTNASLYTSPNGEYIDFNTKMDIQRSDTNNNLLYKGHGFAIDLFYQISFNKRLSYGIYACDFGGSWWSESAFHFSKDSVIHFKGVEIENVLSFDSQSFNALNSDTILGELLTADQSKSFFTWHPSRIGAFFNYNPSSRSEIKINAQYQLIRNEIPEIGGLYSYQLLPWLKCGINMIAGGYSKWNAGTFAEIKTNKFAVYIGSHHLASNVLNSPHLGLGGFISFKYYGERQ